MSGGIYVRLQWQWCIVCLFVNLCGRLHKCMNASICSLWTCLPLEIPKGCEHYCCHPLQFHKIYESPINRAVCQLSSIPGATAQLIACTWATKVFFSVLTLHNPLHKGDFLLRLCLVVILVPMFYCFICYNWIVALIHCCQCQLSIKSTLHNFAW